MVSIRKSSILLRRGSCYGLYKHCYRLWLSVCKPKAYKKLQYPSYCLHFLEFMGVKKGWKTLTTSSLCCLWQKLICFTSFRKSHNLQERHTGVKRGLILLETGVHLFWYFADRASQYIYLNINRLDALNFVMSLFHASTCFEHMRSSSGSQNCTIQPLVSSHL